MPTYQVTDPDSGKTLRLTGESPPTEQELEEVFSSYSGEPQSRFGDEITDAIFDNPVGETLLEFASAVNRGTAKAADFFTTEQVNNILQIVGSEKKVPSINQSLSPATTGNFMSDGLGKDVVRTSGEIAPAAVTAGGLMRNAASRLPSASAAESTATGVVRQMGSGTATQDAVIGLTSGAGSELGGEVGRIVDGDRGEQIGEFMGAIVAPLAPGAIGGKVSSIREAAAARKALGDAAPSSSNLKDAAHKIYQQIDDLGVSVPSKPLQDLSVNTQNLIKREGFNSRIHPKTAAALDEMAKAVEKDMTPSELDIIRRVANAAAKSFDNPDDARLGRMIVGQIDEFMGNTLPQVSGVSNSDEIASLYKQAQGLWARARKAETIDEAIFKAQNQASGFENGLRSQFRQIINSKKRRAPFNQEEIAAMTKVVRGGKAENIARALGKFGFTEGQASSMLMSYLGVAGGAAVGGPVGAFGVALTGQGSKAIAQRMTRGNAKFASQLAQAGTDGRKITAAYLRHAPEKHRNVEELSSLLIYQKVPSDDIQILREAKNRFIADAAYFASVLGATD